MQPAAFPGTPGVVAGHNGRVAWGVTNVNPDVQDLVEEKVDPANPKKGTVVKKVALPKSTTDITAILKELEGAGK